MNSANSSMETEQVTATNTRYSKNLYTSIQISFKTSDLKDRVRGVGGGGGLIGMCRWMGSHFQQSYQKGVTHFRILGGKTVLHIYCQQTYQNVYQYLKIKVMGAEKLHICSKVTKMGSIIGHRIDYNAVGNIHSKNVPKYPPPPPPGGIKYLIPKSCALLFRLLVVLETLN